MAARIEKEIKAEMNEFSRNSRTIEKLTFVLFIMTIVFIAVNIPSMLVNLKGMGTFELASLFVSEMMLVLVILYVARTVLSR
jgi:hypothetical protein